MSQTLSRFTEVFQDVFDDSSISLLRETTAADVDEWDSLMHVNLILAAERAFSIRFSSTEVAQLLDIGGLVDLIDSKLANAG